MTAKLIKLKPWSLAITPAVVAGIFIVIQAVAAAVMLISDDPGSTFLICSAALPIAAGLTALVASYYYTWLFYTCAVEMSCTRRAAVGGILAVIFAASVLAMLLARVLSAAEQLLVYEVWSARHPSLAVSGSPDIIPLWLWGAMALCAPMAGFSISAFILRFGKTALILLWLVWMAFCFMPAYLEHVIERVPAGILYLLPGLIAVWFVWSLCYMRRAPVK